MIQFFKRVISFLFGIEFSNNNCEKECFEDNCSPLCENKKEVDVEDTPVKAYSKIELLELEKQKAIKECDGCENEVYVLKMMGEDVGYAKSLNQLIIKHKLPKNNTYKFWNNKQQLNRGEKAGLLLNKYDIIKLA